LRIEINKANLIWKKSDIITPTKDAVL